jgi:hypothetical protein
MRYAPNYQRARGTKERRPAVKKLSTVRKSGSKIFKEHQLTIGLDLGDRSSCYCVLNDRGEVIREGSVSTNKECGWKRDDSTMERSKTGVDSGSSTQRQEFTGRKRRRKNRLDTHRPSHWKLSVDRTGVQKSRPISYPSTKGPFTFSENGR